LAVLEQDRTRRQRGTDLLDAEGGPFLQGRELFVGPPYRVQRFDELGLESASAMPKRLNRAHGAFVGPNFLELDLPIVPVQLLAKAAHLFDEIALNLRRQGAGAEGDEVGEASGLRLLDVAEGCFLMVAGRSECQTG